MSYSPELNAAAIAKGYTGHEDYLNNNPQGQSSGGSGGGSWNGGEVFNAAKSALQQRYDSLIQGIKVGTEKQITRQTTTTNNEMGKRGILSSSGLAQQEMTNALNPINEASNAQMAGAGADFNTGMANLALGQFNSQQEASQNAIKNALAERQMKNEEANTASLIADRAKSSSIVQNPWLISGGGTTGGSTGTTEKNKVNSGWIIDAGNTAKSAGINALQAVDPMVKWVQNNILNPAGKVANSAVGGYTNWLNQLGASGPKLGQK